MRAQQLTMDLATKTNKLQSFTRERSGAGAAIQAEMNPKICLAQSMEFIPAREDRNPGR